MNENKDIIHEEIGEAFNEMNPECEEELSDGRGDDEE
jgi:hypothetical protein